MAGIKGDNNNMQNNNIMTTKELAEYIKMNEKTVLKMAKNGELPGKKIGNQWRFHLATIDKYLQGDIIRYSDKKLDLIINTADKINPLSRFIGYDYMNIDSQAKTSDEVLLELANIVYETKLTSQEDKLLEELRNRERMLSTAIGNGMAIPHTRYPSIKLFKESKIILLRTRQGIDFGAQDGIPVSIFFMTCAQNEFIHLRLLAKISRLLHCTGVREDFMNAETKEQMMQIFLKFDREYMFTRIAA
ncbi:MAG: PTS sugar transporter subunit IIA [Candidatus Omnitrophica bacterium]|nr:PTS sugar transporter subunit IIA [Candidatus Omnitrophota bacterium]